LHVKLPKLKNGSKTDTLNKMKKNILILLFIGVGFMSSCYYDKKDQIYPQVAAVACDTTNSTYKVVVAPIIQSNCGACHATSVANSKGAGIVLDNYTSVKTYVNNKQLLNSILQNGIVPAMPLNAAKLDACTINKISAWINQGALNN
jgi:mono/diheme cytochrome c family protein